MFISRLVYDLIGRLDGDDARLICQDAIRVASQAEQDTRFNAVKIPKQQHPSRSTQGAPQQTLSNRNTPRDNPRGVSLYWILCCSGATGVVLMCVRSNVSDRRPKAIFAYS